MFCCFPRPIVSSNRGGISTSKQSGVSLSPVDSSASAYYHRGIDMNV